MVTRSLGWAVILPLLVICSACNKSAPAPKASNAKPASESKPAASAETFTGDQLTLTLNSDDTGSVTLNGKTYPLRVFSSANGHLQGTFTSNSKPFNWSATRNGDQLVFTTAHTDYHLLRQTSDADNPLARHDTQPPPAQKAQSPPATPTAAQPAHTTSASPGPGAMRFTRLSVHDPGINNIEAVSFLIPKGWKADGGVQWFPNYSILANLLMKITDPQTGAQIEFLPLQNFTYLKQMVVPMRPGTNYLGNIVWQPIEDIPQFIRTFYLPKTLPQLQDARMIGQEELPKIAQQYQQMLGGRGTVKSARVRYAYTVNDKPWIEDVYVTLTYFPWRMGTIWSVASAYSFRAPADQIDRLTPVMATTISSIRLSQDWYSGYMYVQKLFNNRMNQSIRDAKAISNTITRNSEEIRQMFAESYRQRNEAEDRISRQFSEYIRGVETYKNPYEDRPIELPSGYNDAWVNANGDYILSNQAGFDPNVGSNVEWRRMQTSN